MKLIFTIYFICSVILFGQVFESGLGTSALLELRMGGYDLNEDGYPDFSNHRVTGRKTIDTTEGVYNQLYSLENNSSQYFPAEIEIGDLNGDGFDDIASVSYSSNIAQGEVEMHLIVYKGDDGEILYEKTWMSLIHESLPPVLLNISDFTGDGIKELCVTTFIENDNNSVAISPRITIFNRVGNELFKEVINTELDNSQNIQLINFDYNGDQYDDLALISGAKTADNPSYKELSIYLYDGNSEQISDVTPSSLKETNVDNFIAVTGNFSSDPRDLLSIMLEKNASFFITTLDFYNGSEITYELEQFADLPFTKLPSLVETGSFDFPGVEQIITSFRCGEDADGDGTPDEFNLVCLNPFSGEKKFGITNPQAGEYFFSQFLITDDYNNDGRDEIIHILRAGPDENNDGIGDGSVIQVINNDGSDLYSVSTASLGLPSDSAKDGIYSVTEGNFSSLTSEIAFLIHSGVDYNGDGVGDGYTRAIFNPLYKKISHFTQNLQAQKYEKPTKIYSITNNFSDKYFLRQIDFSDPLLGTTKDFFLARNYQSAMNSFFHYYMKKRKHPVDYSSQEYYFIDQRDQMIDRLTKFSTAVTMEVPGFQFYSNIYDEASAGALRLGRIASSFSERFYDRKNIDQATLIYSLKSILSHLRWLDRPENYTPGNNHALLFEIKEYFMALGHIKEFKQFKIEDDFSFQKSMEIKISDQLHHIFDDGIHDEHSITYSFLIANACDRMLNFIFENQFFNLSDNLVLNLLDKVEKQYRYFLYAVKPIELNTANGMMQIRPDIPVYGDSESKIVGKWYGKLSRGTSYSLLDEPIKSGYTDNWKDPLLILNLDFAANSNITQKGKAPEQISRFFPIGGYFVSRSNWTKFYNRDMYDISARYMHFKAGDIVPRGGVYDGYTTNSRHGHADLLSVDLAGHNKNIVVDPGGYVNPSMTEVLDTFIPTYYQFLYENPPPEDKFEMVRSYFKSTAAHNTVNINRGQAIYKSNWRWFDLNSIFSHSTDYFTGVNFDYIKAGYSKIDSKGEYSHVRTVLYNKPTGESGVIGDYWIFVDKLDFTNYSGVINAEQIWHISPEQEQQSLASDGKFTADNFIMTPLKFNDDYRVFPSVLPGYTMTYWDLNYSRIIKYKALMDDNLFTFVTLILPFDENEKISDVSFSPVQLYDMAGALVDAFNGTGMKVKFTLAGGEVIEDYVSINDNIENFVWKPEFSNNIINSSNKVDFFRLVDGTIYLSDSITADSISTKSVSESPQNFELYQNYPNPFNIETTITVNIHLEENYKIEVYDILGRKIKTLVDNYLTAGEYNFRWNGRDSDGNIVASGIYFYTLNTSSKILSKKMVLLK
ncbi:MAG: hypothetical protein SCALA702_11730 [Melioribacteraceae bacterium]|nr:MAG: hypothetical protein SCALA702_11730 [Melioribacteraceae bacterium]